MYSSGDDMMDSAVPYEEEDGVAAVGGTIFLDDSVSKAAVGQKSAKRSFRKLSSHMFAGMKQWLNIGNSSDIESEGSDTVPPLMSPPPRRSPGMDDGNSRMTRRRSNSVPDASVDAVGFGLDVVKYSVKADDTVQGIAMRHNMKLGAFMKLNKMYGSQTLYTGQTVLVTIPRRSVSSDDHLISEGEEEEEQAPKELPIKVLNVRKSSSLDGTMFDATLVDHDTIEVQGWLEVNSLYISFSPEKYHQVKNTDREVLDAPESKKLLQAYGFRLDLREVQGCSAGERRTPPPEVQEKQETEQEQATNKEEHSSSVLSVKIYWSNKGAGFVHPDPIEFRLGSVEMCQEIATAIQEFVAVQRNKQNRYLKLNIDETNSLTRGSVVSGLLFKRDSSCQDLSSLAQTPSPSSPASPDLKTTWANTLAENTQDNLKQQRSAVLEGSARIQQSLLRGEISKEEALALIKSNNALLERIEQLEAEIMRDIVEVDSASSSSSLLGKMIPTPKSKSPLLRSQSATKMVENRIMEGLSLPSPVTTKKQDSLPPPTFSLRESWIIEDGDALAEIRAALPETLHGMWWRMLYNFDECGVHLKNMYKFVAGQSQTLMLVKTMSGDVFGAFASEEWSPRKGHEFYGTGESFVFAFQPKLHIYKWTGANDFIMSSSSSHFGMGADPGFAFCFDEDLDDGTSGPCKTFGMQSSLPKRSEFRIAQMEIFGFEQPIRKDSSSGDQSSSSKDYDDTRGTLFRSTSSKIQQSIHQNK